MTGFQTKGEISLDGKLFTSQNFLNIGQYHVRLISFKTLVKLYDNNFVMKRLYQKENM
jgi:hypothetical protein